MTDEEFERRAHEYLNVQLNETSQLQEIDPKECTRTEQEQGALSEHIYHVWVFHCGNVEAKETEKFEEFFLVFLLIIVSLMCTLMIWFVGCYKVMDRLFYFFTFHWVLKLIIRLRDGQTIRGQIDHNLKEIVENDEEMANAIVDTDNEVDMDEMPQEEKVKVKKETWQGA